MSTRRTLEIIDKTIKAAGTGAEWTEYADALVDNVMTYSDMTAVLGFLLDAGYVDNDALVNALGEAIKLYADEKV